MSRNNSVKIPGYNEEKHHNLAVNGAIKNLVGFIDSVNIGIIYTLFLKPLLFNFYEQLGKYIFFPIASVAALISAALSWRQAYIKKGSKSSVLSALIDTLSALAITVAVLGSLLASSLFVLATPIIFTAVMGGKTLFSTVASIYYFGKAAGAVEPSKKKKYYGMSKDQLLAAMAGTIATAATVGVFLLGKTFLAGIGIAAAGIGSLMALTYGYQSFKAALKPSNHSTCKNTAKTGAVSHIILPQKKPRNKVASSLKGKKKRCNTDALSTKHRSSSSLSLFKGKGNTEKTAKTSDRVIDLPVTQPNSKKAS